MLLVLEILILIHCNKQLLWRVSWTAAPRLVLAASQVFKNYILPKVEICTASIYPSYSTKHRHNKKNKKTKQDWLSAAVCKSDTRALKEEMELISALQSWNAPLSHPRRLQPSETLTPSPTTLGIEELFNVSRHNDYTCLINYIR